jgi:uncharacterized hydrophobic protein (TIGR00271 family)
MVRLVTVNVPFDKRGEITSVLDPFKNKYVFHMTCLSSDESFQITFKCRDKHLQLVLEELHKVGCGRYYGHIDVMMVILSRPAINTLGTAPSGKKQRQYRISERMTVDEIHAIIDDGNHLTFNYMALLLMASIIAGIGLLTNSDTTVIASMLVSPLMGPILSITFGVAVWDIETIRRGVRNEIVGIFISLTTGIFMGFIASFLYPPDYRSGEMTSRGEGINLIGGFIVAVASGAAVVVAVSMGGVNAIVGTAISASLLPPIVNAGICLSMALKYHFANNVGRDSFQYAVYGGVSDFFLF